MQLNTPSLRRVRVRQSGFTLVEIAIVLIIIGLLLGGVLKGQELIENGRVKAAANDMNGILAAHHSYFDRYRRVPGDDGPIETLIARGGKWATLNESAVGDRDGILLEDPTSTFAPTAEGSAYFAHLRAAGFLNGDHTISGTASLPVNPWGGLTGVTQTTGANPVQNRTTTSVVLCMGNVPGKAAQALDTQFDDGRPDTGALQATTSTVANEAPVGAAATAYTEDTPFTLCRDLL